MTIRDRGKIKWQGAFFMPEHVKMLGNLRTDYYRTKKPQLDTYQLDEFDEVIREAMAENIPIKISVWQDGFSSELCGKVHFFDTLTHQIQVEVQPGDYERVNMADIIDVGIGE
jgi:hypothetical protein